MRNAVPHGGNTLDAPKYKRTHLISMHSALTANQRGQSLIEVMTSVGIMALISMGMVSMFTYQNKEVTSLKEKLGITDFQQQLTRAFADGTLCTSLLAGASPARFNIPIGGATATSPASITLTMSAAPASIPVSTLPSAPTLATAGGAISLVSTTLVAAAPQPFQLTNIVGSSNGTTGTFTANFQVNIDDTKLVRALKPPATMISLQTSGGVTGTQTITGCSGATKPRNVGTSLSNLMNYHDGCTGCPSVSVPLLNCVAACNRFCSAGCSGPSSNCTIPQPGLGFSGGTFVECDASTGNVQCLCTP